MKALLSESEKPEFDANMFKDNSRSYTGLTKYDTFRCGVDYLEPRIKAMRSWKGSSTYQYAGKNMFCNALVICLLPIDSFYTHLTSPYNMYRCQYKILKQHKGTCLLATWICLLSKELCQIFHFLSCKEVS